MTDKISYRLPPQNIFLIIAIIAIAIALGLIAGGIAYTVVTANKTSDYVKTDYCNGYCRSSRKKP